MDQIQTEMNLVNTNLVANEKFLAQDHLNKINELFTENIKKEIAERNKRIANEISSIINETSIAIGKEVKNNREISQIVKNFNDVKEEAISIRIDQDALTNATVHALYFADLINSIDASYAAALGTKPVNISDMNMSHGNYSRMSHSDSNTMSSDMKMDHGDSSSTMASMKKDTEHNSNTNETSTITNIVPYQTAKELTNIAIDLFNLQSSKIFLPMLLKLQTL
jgi:DNA primase catalytic subunit